MTAHPTAGCTPATSDNRSRARAAVLSCKLRELQPRHASAGGLDESFGTLAFIGGLALMLWNLLTAWSGQRRWPAKLWSVVLTLSAASVLWLASVFKLISLGASY